MNDHGMFRNLNILFNLENIRLLDYHITSKCNFIS